MIPLGIGEVNRKNQYSSIINMLDIMEDLITIGVIELKKHFDFYINSLYSLNRVKFEDLREIIKFFNKNDFYTCIVKIKDFRKEITKEYLELLRR